MTTNHNMNNYYSNPQIKSIEMKTLEANANLYLM
jgi:hypothetical protein